VGFQKMECIDIITILVRKQVMTTSRNYNNIINDLTEILLKVALNSITLECIHEHFINYFKRTEKIVTCVFP
jgi:hypothetical protein